MKWFPHFHRWKVSVREGTRFVFFVRACRCGKVQIEDRSHRWHDLDSYRWTFEFERAEFEAAK